MERIIKIAIDDGLASIKGAAGIGNNSNVLYQGMKEHFEKNSNIRVSFKKYPFISLYPKHVRRFLYLFCMTFANQKKDYDLIHFTNYYNAVDKVSSY